MADRADRRMVDGPRWGIEPICRVLTEHGTPIAPSTFYDARDRGCARTERDEDLRADIARVNAPNHGVYGARKVWLALNREGRPVARCTVERVGTVGDALDNALAETQIGLVKTELIRRRGPWEDVDDVELATLDRVDWHNDRRLHTACHDLTPGDYEQVSYGQHPAQQAAGVSNPLSLRTRRGGSVGLHPHTPAGSGSDDHPARPRS